jgi:DNA polymerase-4
MAILGSFSPVVEQVSVDEAFVDISGTGRLFGTPRQTAAAIARRILEERDLTASIGIAPNKYLAKIASDLHKPNGITEVPRDPGEIVKWLAPLPIGRVWGIGVRTQEVLASRGITTIGDLQALSMDYLQDRWGAPGAAYYRLARGIDDRQVGDEDASKSISREHTFDRDCADPAVWQRVLLSLSRDVARRARAAGVKGATVVFIYRGPDFTKHTRRKTLSEPTDLARRLFETGLALMQMSGVARGALRLIGVGLTNFDEDPQLDLFGPDRSTTLLRASESAMDRINEKFGRQSIIFAGEIGDKGDSP